MWLEKVEIPNYNKCKLLIFTQNIEEPLSTRVSACSEASLYYFNEFYIYIYIYKLDMGWVVKWDGRINKVSFEDVKRHYFTFSDANALIS